MKFSKLSLAVIISIMMLSLTLHTVEAKTQTQIGQYSPPSTTIIQETDTFTLTNLNFLPLTLKQWPPKPYIPTLHTIYPAVNGNYTITWSEHPSRLAQTYTLQEASNLGFSSNVLTVCTTYNQEFKIFNKTPGVYFYRVRGNNQWFTSEWSNEEIVTIPHAPIQCTISYTTEDKAPTGNTSFATAATLANYTGQSLLDVSGKVGIGGTYYTKEDYYRMDNAVGSYRYTVKAVPDRTINYDLGIIVYDKNQQAIITDSNSFDGNSAKVILETHESGPYYFRVFQRSEQCQGSTYSLILHMEEMPVDIGGTVLFKGSWKNLPFKGKITTSRYHGVFGTYKPDGIFLILIMDVINYGKLSDEVGRHDSFKIQDPDGRIYDMANINIQQEAKEAYDLKGVYDTIQPNLTTQMIFAFDVPTQTKEFYLTSMSPW